MAITTPRKGLKLLTTTPIRPKAADVASGTIKLYSTASNQEIPIGTKGLIMDVADERVWIDLMVDSFGRPLSISIDIRSFGSYFEITDPLKEFRNQ